MGGLGAPSSSLLSDNDDGIVVRNADGSLDYGCKGQVLVMMMMPPGSMGMGMGMHGDGSGGGGGGEVSSSSGGYMNQSVIGGEGGCMGMGIGMGMSMGVGVGVMGGGGGGVMPSGLGDQERERLAEMVKRHQKRLPGGIIFFLSSPLLAYLVLFYFYFYCPFGSLRTYTDLGDRE